MAYSNTDAGERWRRLLRWFQPGLGVKRWLLLMVLGTALIGLGLAVFLLDVYRSYPESSWLQFLSLSVLPRWLRAVIFGGSGILILLFSAMRLNRSLLAPYLQPGKSVVETVAEHRRLGRGPRIVAIGGGTGISTLLRGLKLRTSNLVAIVTMADDGGSSGRLRRSLGLPPPGDLRNCIAALSDDEALLTNLFQYRFLDGDELGGHSFGNLFIAALAGATGSFEKGILEAGRVLSIQGKVIPATMRNVALLADKAPSFDVQAVRIEGESSIPSFPGRIQRVQLEPDDAPAYPEALNAILNADMIIIGPGSLYTSILPNLLIPDITAAIKATRCFKVFVCNVASQAGETDGYSCEDHIQAIEEHVGKGLFDLVVANDCFDATLPTEISWVKQPDANLSIPIYMTDLVNSERPSHHDPIKLSETLISLLEERTGPLQLPPIEDLEQLKNINT
jgi:uncharacterized cofD-like protein